MDRVYKAERVVPFLETRYKVYSEGHFLGVSEARKVSKICLLPFIIFCLTRSSLNVTEQQNKRYFEDILSIGCHIYLIKHYRISYLGIVKHGSDCHPYKAA